MEQEVTERTEKRGRAIEGPDSIRKRAVNAGASLFSVLSVASCSIETLAALGGLKAARYVVDKGADLKLYGLGPPELVLEVETPTGQWVLHIGRSEGESKRSYAHVPGKDRSEVFIISEGDAARLMRDLSAFTK